jgi:hypothetical protein
MSSRRDLLARIGRAAASRVFGAVQGAVSDLGKGTLERLAERMESGLRGPTPPAPPPPAPPPPAPTQRQREPRGTDALGPTVQQQEKQAKQEADGLIADLQALHITTRQIVERLTALGYRESAEAIYKVPEVPNINDRGAVPAEPPKPPPIKPKKPEKKPLPEIAPPTPEAKYRLQGSIIQVPYVKNLRFLYRMLNGEWKRIGMGKKKDGTPQPEGNVYAANAILQAKAGSTTDAGIRIPPEVLRNEDAFVEWATENGYSEGGSIMVDGMIPPPGGAFAGERVWTVNAEAYRDLDKDEA